VGGMAGKTIADSGPGLVLSPHPLSTNAMHVTVTTEASVPLFNE
jgi:hypothetical protein